MMMAKDDIDAIEQFFCRDCKLKKEQPSESARLALKELENGSKKRQNTGMTDVDDEPIFEEEASMTISKESFTEDEPVSEHGSNPDADIVEDIPSEEGEGDDGDDGVQEGV
jgi:hypothetical protein